MRPLLVALCVCALAIAARAQCTTSEATPCNGNGKCNNGRCECYNVVRDGVTTQYSGDKCSSYSSWWYTPRTNTETVDQSKCVTNYKTNGLCNTKGDHGEGKCRCKTEFDGNVTTEWHGPCCQNWYSSWRTSSSYGEKKGGDAGKPLSCNAATTCSGRGTCAADGTCICSKTVVGNKTTEYYGPNCNSWHSWWFWWNSATSSYSRSEVWGNGYMWKADGIGMRNSRQEWYCWCPNVVGWTAGSGTLPPCTAKCVADYTCNKNGACDTTNKNTCVCKANFAGRWCDQCKLGWGNSNSSDVTKLCDVCAPGWFPEGTCTKQCLDASTTNGCSGHGTCNANGACACNAGYEGSACDKCKVKEGYELSNGTCSRCTAGETCSNNGICTKDGRCVCGSGFKGERCNECTSATGSYPKCPGAVTRSGAAAASEDCPGPNLALPIILSILGTLLIMLIAFAIYRMWAAKQAGAGGAGTAKSSNWSEFEKDSSTAYSQL